MSGWLGLRSAIVAKNAYGPMPEPCIMERVIWIHVEWPTDWVWSVKNCASQVITYCEQLKLTSFGVRFRDKPYQKPCWSWFRSPAITAFGFWFAITSNKSCLMVTISTVDWYVGFGGWQHKPTCSTSLVNLLVMCIQINSMSRGRREVRVLSNLYKQLS